MEVETLYILAMAGYPIISAILLFHHLKMRKHETQKKTKRTAKKVLHSKPGRNSTVDEFPQTYQEQQELFTDQMFKHDAQNKPRTDSL